MDAGWSSKTRQLFFAALILLSAAPVSAATGVSSISCVDRPGYTDDCSYTGKNTGSPAYWFYNLLGDTPSYSGYAASAEPDGTQINIPNGGDNCGMPPSGEDIALYGDVGGTDLLCGTRYDCSANTWVLFGPCAPAPPPPIPPTPPPSGSGSGGNTGTIQVIKTVVNDNGGTKVVSDFPLFVNGTLVASGQVRSYRAPADVYAVTETSDPYYAAKFSGDCDIDGRLTLSPGENKVCIVTNDDVFVPAVIPPTVVPPPVVPPVPPLIDVVKVPSPLALPAGPGPVTYTYTLHNIGTVPVTDVTMTGDSCAPILLTSGDINHDARLDVNEVWTYTCSVTLSQTNTGTVAASGWANGLNTVDLASATVVVAPPGLPETGVVVPPLIHVKEVPSPLTLPAAGGTVTYTDKVTNPGKAAVSDIRVSDDACGPLKYVSGDKNGDAKLDPSETWTYTCRKKLTRTTTDTVIATGQANGLTARDFAIVTVVVATPVPPAIIPAAKPPATASATAVPERPEKVLAPPIPGQAGAWSVVAACVLTVLLLLYAIRDILRRRALRNRPPRK